MVARPKPGDSVIGEAGASLESHFIPWDPSFIRKLLIGLVRKKIGLFATYPEIGKEDLLQVAEKAMTDAWPKWNPTRAALSTYLYKAGANAIVSLWRDAERRHRGEKCDGYDEETAGNIQAPLESLAATLAGVEWNPNESVRDWLKRLHDAVRGHPDTRRRTKYTLAQAVCISMLMRRLKLGYKGAAEVLQQQEDYREAIRLNQVPTSRMIGFMANEFGGGSQFTPRTPRF